MIARRFFLALVFLPAIGPILAEERPNLLFITSEDNSAHWLGCYGNTQAQTPRLDALAAEGLVFDHAYSNAPVCAVARATILMGMHAPAMGVQHMRSRHPIPADWRPGVEFLRAAGYYATNNSKTDYNIRGDDRAHWDDSSNRAHYRKRPEGAPFYAVFNLHETHESSLFDDKPADPRRLRPDEVILPPYLPDLPEIRRDIARYHDRLEDMDASVGRLLDGLERDGLADSTIVIYLSDHGGVLPRDKRYLEDTGVRVPMIVRIPEKFRHLSPFEPGTRVDELVSFVDLAPTFLSLIGLEAPANMQGRPFLGTHRRAPRNDEMVFLYADRFDEIYGMRRGITDGKWKYIRNFKSYLPNAPFSFYQFRQPGWRAYRQAWIDGKLEGVHQALWQSPSPVEQLYDLESDPWEVRNLAGDPAHAEKLATMRAHLQAVMASHRDTGIIPEPMFAEVAGEGTLAEWVRADPLGYFDFIELAFIASEGSKEHLPKLEEAAASGHPVKRYWAALGMRLLGEDADRELLKKLAADTQPAVQALAAESLILRGDEAIIDNLVATTVTASANRDALNLLNLLNTLRRLDVIDRLPDTLRGSDDYTKRLLNRLRDGKD